MNQSKDIVEPLIEWRVLPREKEGVGLTPRGRTMPKTMEEWRYLADLYAKKLITNSEEISILKNRIYKLEQKLGKSRRTK